MTSKINEIRTTIESKKTRGAWASGVKVYALELIEEFEEWALDGWVNLEEIGNATELEKVLLNGARNWLDYSWGGSSLIYNYDIAKRLCNKSELKKTKAGLNRPNKKEDWLDVQARALNQAFWMIRESTKF